MANVNVTRSEPQRGARNGGELATIREAPELAPAVDIYENQDELLLVVDLPGVAPQGVSVDYDAPELRIRAQREDTSDGASYFRAFRVDERIDPNGIEAELRNGVLSVHLKKSAELRPRRIEVKAN